MNIYFPKAAVSLAFWLILCLPSHTFALGSNDHVVASRGSSINVGTGSDVYETPTRTITVPIDIAGMKELPVKMLFGMKSEADIAHIFSDETNDALIVAEVTVLENNNADTSTEESVEVESNSEAPDPTSRAPLWLKEQVAEMKSRLDKSENRLIKFRQINNINDGDIASMTEEMQMELKALQQEVETNRKLYEWFYSRTKKLRPGE